MKLSITIFILFAFMSIMACKEKYDIKVRKTEVNILVIEGTLNGGVGGTFLQLSRTVPLEDSQFIKPELNAKVDVQAENSGEFYTLNEIGPGYYFNESTPLNANTKYRLKIETTDGKSYVSDYVPVLQTPPIDSVHWKRENEDINIYVDTHDPTNSTKYYRWTYGECWHIRSYYPSSHTYEDGVFTPRPSPFDVYDCWRYDSATNVVINNTASYSNDVIQRMPIMRIPNGSEKISVQYSILVRQHALTKDAYEYWERVKKNTEQIGTIFDPQPSINTTNIRCENDTTQVVIGYVSACKTQAQRIFIKLQDVRPWAYREFCEIKEVPPDSIDIYFGSRGYLVVGQGQPGIWYGSTEPCVDCTIRGVPVKPSFWP
jgi:hypothetical protein